MRQPVDASPRSRRRFIAQSIAAGAALAFPVPVAAKRCKSFYIGGHTRHASIIVDRRDFDPAASLGTAEFDRKYWLEFGWGDADFYQAKGEDVLLGAKALFLPTDTVMHVHGFNGTPQANFPETEILEIQVTPDGYGRLLAFLRASFAQGKDGKAVPLGKGLYGLSRFYEGTGTYSMFNTCNTWTARALAAGGFPIDPAEVGTVGQFMDQVRGKRVADCPVPVR